MLDVLRPYFFIGMDLGPGVQDALALLHVDEYETAWDDDAVVIWGVARIDSDDPSSPVFSPHAFGGAPAGSTGPSDQDLKWEWHDVAVRFRATIARRAAAALEIAQVTSSDVQNVLQALGPDTGTAPSDYPGTQFRLELMFELVTVTFPKLIGAKLDGWVLVPDPAHREVKISLPKILLILTQDSASDADFNVSLGSWGAETLDDADPAIASLIQMTPPYALIPGEQFGFGFKKAVVDFSNERTPPELLSRFGVGEDWQGIYLPEVRLFASTQRSAGVAFNIGAREMLIGLDPTPGIWGDFNFDMEILGDQLRVGLRLYGVSGARFDPELVISDNSAKTDRYQITVPSTAGPDTENYVLFVDVNSGAAPFIITAVAGEDHPEDVTTLPDDAIFDDPTRSPEDISVPQRLRLFSHDQRVAIRVTSRNPAQRRIIVLDIYPDLQTSASTQPPPAPEVPRAVLTPEAASESIASQVQIASQTDDDAILRLNPADGSLTVDGTPVPVTDGQARIPIAAEDSHAISVTWNRAGEIEVARYTVSFQYNHPKDGVIGTVTSSGDLDALVAAWNAQPSTARRLRVDGYASREAGSANTSRNNPLSVSRAEYLLAQLDAHGISRTDVGEENIGGWGNQGHPSSTPGVESDLIEGQVPGDHSAEAEWAEGNNPNYHPEAFRIAVVSLLVPQESTQTYTGTLSRGPVEDPETHNERPAEPPAPQGQTPGWLRHIGGMLRFERDIIPVGGELRMTVDFQTAHEEGLEEFRNDVDVIGPGLEDPAEQERLPQGDPNPEDGVVEFRLGITYDPTTDTFTETLVARAGAGDRDGLWSWGSIPAAPDEGEELEEPESDGWRDVLGLYFTLAPLLSATAADAAGGGEIVPLAITLATPVVITTLGVVHVLRFTHYGVELTVRHDDDEVHSALLFDVESALWLNLKIGTFVIVTNKPDKPVKIRYKAVGFKLDAPPDAPVSFLPVFDSSRGYTIDLADSGSLRVLPSLGDSVGDIIQVLGARIARTNPLNLEVELGMGVDLGVVSVDKFGFRLPVDPLGPPTITALGVGINIPEVLEGKGYLEIKEDGFAGQLDLTLPSVGMRIAGALAVRTATEGDRSATAVLVTLAAELPTGIPLGGTGLAIFGFLGLFAMHHARLENLSARNPALDWLVNVVHGDPTDLRGWGPKLDAWAFGLGLVAGTIEGGTVLNLKGMLVLELPGPRVLLFVKANILSERPDTKGTDTGALFAVVDVNPQRVLIGIQFEYEIEAVLDLKVPIEAGFFYDPPLFPPEHFYVDAGTIAQPITAKVLQLFDATAYFMVHGDGIPDFPLGALQGFSVAAGFRSSFIWGNTDIGLYLRIASGFDVGIGFAPLFFAGRIFIEGELRLFIVSIEASGKLTFRSNGVDTLLDGEICGRVSFFFFSVKGCVGFAIGTDPSAPPVPDPIRDLLLQSRSPALIEGTGVDRGIDTVLCHGTTDGSVPVVEVRDGDTVIEQDVFVPIDAIPLVQFEVAPKIASGATIDGQLSSGLPAGFPQGWQKRGQNFVRYTIRSVELRLVTLNGSTPPPGTQPVTEGPRPYTWRHPAQAAGSDGLPVELALLDWKPTNVDKALLQGPALDSLVDSRWDTVCTPVAAAARVLWTFRYEPLGPSPDGWHLVGEPWPDDPGSHRSLEVNTDLRVSELWRTGTFLDGLLPTIEATVVGILRPCPQKPRREVAPHVELADRARLSAAGRQPEPNGAGRRPGASASVAPRPGGALSARAASLCGAKVLQAPYELLAESFPMPGDPLHELLLALDDQRKEDLRDAIRLTGGPFLDLTLLIFARTKMVEKGLIQVRAFAPGGIDPVDLAASFTRVATDGDLPPQWLAADGPWWDDIFMARQYFAALEKEGEWSQYLVHIKLDKPALIIDIGVSPLVVAIHEFGMTPPSFFLAAIDALSEAEVLREETDEDESSADEEGLEDALDGEPHALLLPNARYEVVVRYDGEIGAKPEEPEPGQDPNEIITLRSVTNQTARRTFYTDSAPPRNIEPWMLAQFPAPDEQYHFYEDPVVLVFATNDVLQLYAAYDRQIKATARAASFRGSAGTPEEPFLTFPIADLFVAIPGAILSPWEATIRRRLDVLPCIDFDPDADHHGRTVLPFLLDPLTDYVLDLELLTMGGSPAPLPMLPDQVGHRPLYRQSFTTSRYPSREAFAEAVRTTLVKAVRVADAGPLLALADTVTDDVFDAALLDSGLEAAARPDFAQVTVLWDTDAPAQPLAIYIETPEPVWRFRREPEAQYDGTGEYILSWRMADAPWLLVDELVREDEDVLVVDGGEFIRRGTGTKTVAAQTISAFRDQYLRPKPLPEPPFPPPPASRVARFIHDASGTRTLAVLNAGARGKTISLGLARSLHPLLDVDTTDTPVVLCEVDLAPPPWEELS
ncbi:MAG: hypothetical protein GXY36_10145 [Chloroflexi bacterium]|nr:hypothetical protein [Chloroflexota bacterium]